MKKSTLSSYLFANIHLSTLFTNDWEAILPHIQTRIIQLVLELSEREGLGAYSKEEVIRKMK
ncbi:MAG: hypothetical protein ACQEWV_30910 [Bacillota bacterium]